MQNELAVDLEFSGQKMKRSREQVNLRRRIYDAWSVLRACNVIQEKHARFFGYNNDVLLPLSDSDSAPFDSLPLPQIQTESLSGLVQQNQEMASRIESKIGLLDSLC